MAKTKSVSTGAQKTQVFDTDSLIIDWSRNRRGRDVDHLCTMIASIRANGLQQPPTVMIEGSRRKPKHYVGPGFHRSEAVAILRHGVDAIQPDDRYDEAACAEARTVVAAFLAETSIKPDLNVLPEIICVVDEHTGLDEAERSAQQIVENLHRKDATMAEIADGVRDMKRLGYTREKIAARLVKNVQWVDRALMFGKKATTELRDASRDGELPNTLAVEAARADPDEQRQIVSDVKNGETPRAAVDKQRKKKGKKPLRKKPTAAALRAMFEEENIESRITGKRPKIDNDEVCNAVARGILAGFIYAAGVCDLPPEKLVRTASKKTITDMLDEALGRGPFAPGAKTKTKKTRREAE